MPTERRAPAALLALALWLAACAPVAERYDDLAAAEGLARREIDGFGLRHAVFAPRHAARGPVLHVYLEGDGTPLLRGRLASADPTPRRPLMPALMALDPSPRLLLGRPCYHGLAGTPPCRPELWTDARFSEAVVASMAAALRRLVAERGLDRVVLIGHSGGGTLALLLAPRLPEVRAVLALASVADTGLWTAHHRLAPLAGSLNPNAPLRPSGVAELFAVGARDRVTPPDLVRAAAARRPGAEVRLYPGFDHACCWAEAWPGLLDWAERVAAAR